ncbi:MAG: glycosyltransferase family 4 protein, partial [Steroidobacter sp.]
LYSRANFVRLVVISQALANWYLAEMPTVRRKSLVVAHDAADDAYDVSAARTARRAGARFTVGYVGQLYPGKGMEIISQLPPRMPEIDFHIIGGTESDLSHWRSKATSSNVFLHGYMAPSALPERIASFDVVLAPYQRKVAVYGKSRDISAWMSPLKIFEYMAAGRAMIASDLPVLREVLANERNALLVPPDSVDAWTAALRRCITDPPLVARIGAQARADFLERHLWSARAHDVLHGY